MIPPSVHDAALATTCRRPSCCLPRAAPGHDASQAQLARREVLVQRWNACHLLHAGGDGQRQCAHWTPGAIRGVVESTSHLSQCSSTLGHLRRAYLLFFVITPGRRRLPRPRGVHKEMRGGRSSPLQLQERSRPDPDGWTSKRLVATAGGEPCLP